MQTFEFFIEDDRYAVPTLEFAQVSDADRARELAAERLRASPHHLSVEVRRANERLFLLTSAQGARDAAAAHRSVR